MPREGITSSTSAACPWCGATGRTAWGTCQACGRTYRPAGWRRTPRRRRPVWLVAAMLGLTTLLVAWWLAPLLPDPITLLFNRPTTQRSSDSRGPHWAMWGRDLQHTRHVADVTHPLDGRLVWSVSLGVPTSSAPVVVDNVLYVGGHFKLFALDASTGQVLWDLPLTGPIHTSPAVAGDTVYLGLQDWRLLALERRTGKTQWEFRTLNPITGSAAVAHGMVYIGSMDGFLYALDAATGKRIWQFKTENQPLSPPALSAGTLFLSATDGSLYALRARTGQPRLRFRTPDRLQDTPVVANGLVYFPSGGRIFAVAAEARELPGEYQFKQVWAQLWLWQFPVPQPPGQRGGRWRFASRQAPHGILSAPAVTPEALYVGDVQGMLHAREARQGTALWQFQAGGAILTAPVVVGPHVYVGADNGVLYALDRTQGTLRWQRELHAPIQTTPVFAHGRLYLRTTDGQLHAME